MLATLANEGNRIEIEKRVLQLRPGVQGRWGKMTVEQAVCHLADTYRVGLGDKQIEPLRLPVPLGIVRWFMLYSRLPWPKGAPTRKEIQQGAGGTPPGNFTQDVTTLLELQTRYCECRSRPRHPIFGVMNDADWLRMGYLHMDHHLRQFGV